MATTKGGNGETATDDLLSDLEEAEPVQRKTSERESTPFVPNEKLMETIAATFGRGHALAIKRAYPTEKEAKKGAAIYLRHALEVASTLENKSAAIRTVANEDGTFRALVQLTHARKAKSEEAAPDAAKDGESKDGESKETAKDGENK